MSVDVALPPAERHQHHRDVTGGWLRPAVFGAMDGLISNFALISGVVGGGASNTIVVVTGLAGLAAGAFSMAAGEYTSVASQAELMRAEIDIEKAELERNPEGELAELVALYEARGLDAETAEGVARQLTAQPELAWRVHVREELGVDPDDLPSPYVAAFSSFTAFALGAIVPLVPFMLGATGLAVAAVISVLGLLGAGAVVARLTARPWWKGALRQLALGVAAAAATFGIGSLVGTSLS
ncbi:VIT1/CCC1 transporter family protein [Microtetraspora sp. AC03309]|uniref:VIT1/CCC1 transporter family protein n=1 Tax=Microtetraspora sp. AC03309 TaxID=2779376 RepID=UPI001E60EC37|nr:VIT1/CCC1 transporter family protein [Microtetraspora sp. AC03309]MCC5574797.1 VIT1/CCC1 transporter family protein [Microtetraspora sp. AC03309]